MIDWYCQQEICGVLLIRRHEMLFRYIEEQPPQDPNQLPEFIKEAEMAEAPVITSAVTNAPGVITIAWAHSGNGGPLSFFIERQNPPLTIGFFVNNVNFYTDMGLQPSTLNTYRVCDLSRWSPGLLGVRVRADHVTRAASWKLAGSDDYRPGRHTEQHHHPVVG
jgi:hypothetical protein